MPRYANLKGSMNPFDNNKPVLSSSERLKNKRDKTIYQAQKQHFQSKRKCGNKNVKYYNNGTMRSIQDYKLQQSLARGNVLCEDCNDRGTLCGSTTRSNFGKIGMGNNLLSELWGGGAVTAVTGRGLEFGFYAIVQTAGFNVIQSDISGVWGPSGEDISKSDLSGGTILNPSHISTNALPAIPMPWGYVNNLINIPRNLDGNLVVVDGSNVLFPSDTCTNLNHLSRKELFPYMKLCNLKTLIKVRGLIPITSSYSLASRNFSYDPSTCNDPSYNVLLGEVIIMNDLTDSSTTFYSRPLIFAGTILSLCCVREMYLTKSAMNDISGNTTPPYGVFDMYIELFNIYNPEQLSFIVNTIPDIDGTSGWRWPMNLHFELSYWKRVEGSPGGGGAGDGDGNFLIADALVESVKMIQGLPNLNQTVGNATKQSYMSCLEDGTKKINFASDNVKKNTLIKGYCGGK
tara:strand:- start:724 stop:2100 length:1377 start_codon:yes stop_codon:yes gene_type:complete